MSVPWPAGRWNWLLWLGLLFIASVYFFPTGVVGRLRNPGGDKSAGSSH
ncbi:ABC transporter permease protein [Bradyrhizobium sp.]|nr:ABC transporter permease protein [Bradyrhizobium sp.]